MPKIPQINPSISPNVPGVAADTGLVLTGAGAEAQGRATFGRGIGQMGGALSDLALKVEQELTMEEARTASLQARADLEIASEEKIRELKNIARGGRIPKLGPDKLPLVDKNGNWVFEKNPDGTPVRISQAWQKWAQDTDKNMQMSMPTRAAQLMFQEQSGGFIASSQIKLVGEENEIRLKELLQSQENLFNTYNKELQKGGSQTTGRFQLHDKSRKTLDLISGSKLQNMGLESSDEQTVQLTLTQMKENFKKAEQQLSKSYYEGQINDIKYAIKRGILQTGRIATLINEIDGVESEVFKKAGYKSPHKMLNEKDAEILKAELISLLGDQKKTDRGMIDDIVRAYESANNLGMQIPDQEKANAFEVVLQGKREGVINEIAATDNLTRMHLSEVVNRPFRDNPRLKLQPRETLDPMLRESAGAAIKQAQVESPSGLLPTIAGAVSLERSDDFVTTKLNSIESEKKADPAKFFMSAMGTQLSGLESDPASLVPANFLSAAKSIDTAAEINRSSPVYLPKNFSKGFGEFFNEANPAVATDKLLKLRAATGKYFPSVMRQMVEEGHLNHEWEFATMVDVNPNQPITARARAVESFVSYLQDHGKKIAAFEPVLKERGEKSKDIFDGVKEKLAPFMSERSAMYPRSPQMKRGEAALIGVVVSRVMENMAKNPNADKGVEIDRAVKYFTENSRHKTEMPRNKLFGFISEGQTGFLYVPKRINDQEIDPDTAQSFTEFISSKRTVAQVAKLAKPPKDYPHPREDFDNQIEDTSIIAPLTDGTGVHFFYEDYKTGQMTPVLVDGESKELRMTWEDLHREFMRSKK